MEGKTGQRNQAEGLGWGGGGRGQARKAGDRTGRESLIPNMLARALALLRGIVPYKAER